MKYFFSEKFSFQRTSSSWKGNLVALAPTNHKGLTMDEITTRYAVQAIFVHFQDFSLDVRNKVEGAVHFKSFWSKNKIWKCNLVFLESFLDYIYKSFGLLNLY